MDTKQLLQHIAVKQLVGTLPETIETMTMDSREAKSGALFVCIPGYTVDGHDYAGAAVKKGAGVIVAERELALPEHVAQIIVSDSSRALGQLASTFYNHPSKEMQMIGVTGTNGKTSVGGIIHALLMELGKKSALSGTIGFNINGNLEASANTTNDALTTQGMIHRAKNEGCSHMSMEVSSHGLILGRLAGVEFNTAIFTNLTHDHLDFHGTMEEYGHAKGLLFSQLGQNLDEQKQAILNADDPWSERYAQMTPHRVFTYGVEQPADFKASAIEMDGAGTRYTLNCAEGEFHVSMKLLGAFNVANTLAAIAALSAEGIPLTDILAALAVIEPIDGRMQKIEADLPISIFIDYAHTPDAIEKAIEAVEPFKTNKVIFLVGTGGNRDKTKRPTMAAKASKAEYVVLTTDDPRDEAYDSIVNDLAKGMTHDAFVCIGDREEAVRHAVQQAEPGDLLIFAGKGHEDFQIIGNKKYPHSDKDIAIDEAKKKFNLN